MKQFFFLLEELTQLHIIEVDISDCLHSPEVTLRSPEAFQEGGL